MRGTIAGKGAVIMDAAAEVNPSMEPAFEVSDGGSHTLQRRDFEDIDTLRAALIDATVEALADGSGPRLHRSRNRL